MEENFDNTETVTLTLHGFGPLAGYLHAGDTVYSIGDQTDEETLYVDQEVKIVETLEIDENKNITLTVKPLEGFPFTITVPAETKVDLKPPF